MIIKCKCGYKNFVRFKCNVKLVRKVWIVFDCYACKLPIIIFSYVDEKKEIHYIVRKHIEPNKEG
ncbi:hypothetical protein CCP1ISM_260003 [Azospirillaceae bacterium]